MDINPIMRNTMELEVGKTYTVKCHSAPHQITHRLMLQQKQ
jgi:hypothetical protein